MRGLLRTSETSREWCRKFGQTFVNELRRLTNYVVAALNQVTSGISMKYSSGSMARIITCGEAVDQDGHLLDILVHSQRSKKAAKRFFRKLLQGLQYVPSVIITDKREERQRGEG